MEDLINDIIDKAMDMKKNPEITDYDIVNFVHVELGKIIYYNNNYSAKLENSKKETEVSINRKSNILKEDTDKSSKTQVCKGMAEIYAEILNEAGIEAKAIGIEAKGETQELTADKAKHYCTIFKIGEQEYIQDYLIESALMRIKIGETNFEDRMPGICTIEEYCERGKKGLMQTELSYEYLKNTFGDSIGALNDNEKLDAIFEKLNQYMNRADIGFGFEEAKDFFFLLENI